MMRILVVSTPIGRLGSGRGGGGNSSRSGGDAKLDFHFLDQLGQIENGHASDGIEYFSFAYSHDYNS